MRKTICLLLFISLSFVLPTEAKTAKPKRPKCYLTVTSTGYGVISPAGGSVTQGQNKTFHFTPGANWMIGNVQVDWVTVMGQVAITKKGQGTLKLKKIQANHWIEVTFVQKPIAIRTR